MLDPSSVRARRSAAAAVMERLCEALSVVLAGTVEGWQGYKGIVQSKTARASLEAGAVLVWGLWR